MPFDRFFIEGKLEKIVTLEGTEFHHLAHVMRKHPEEVVELVNGQGTLAKAKVQTITKHFAKLEVLSFETISPHLPKIILSLPFLRLSKLELVIEKCTELGAEAFWLYPAEYSEKDTLSEHQLQRLQQIAISAMKQCGRLDLPTIQVLTKFEDLFENNLKSQNLFFGDTRPNAKNRIENEGVFITGPERGFSDKELKILDQKATGVKLHQNILRAETAPIVAVCLMQSREKSNGSCSTS